MKQTLYAAKCFICGKQSQWLCGHLHATDGQITAGWCDECVKSKKADKEESKPIAGCQSPSGCMGKYNEQKHGAITETTW